MEKKLVQPVSALEQVLLYAGNHLLSGLLDGAKSSVRKTEEKSRPASSMTGEF